MFAHYWAARFFSCYSEFDIFVFSFVVFLAIEYFDDGSSKVSKTICRYMKGEMRVLVNRLDEHKINYHLDQEGVCIHIQGDLSSMDNITSGALLKIEHIRPPVGLSQSWGTQNGVIAKKLNDNNIEFSRRHYNGVEFLSWDLKSHNKVETLLGFSEWEVMSFLDGKSLVPHVGHQTTGNSRQENMTTILD